MLLISNHKMVGRLQEEINDLKIFNLSSLVEGYDRVNILPLNNVECESERDFDIAYSEYIMNTDRVFSEFFGKIIYNIYNGSHVCLLTSEDTEFEFITESITKLIQQRYGLDSIYIYDEEDIVTSGNDTDFSIPGLANLDLDKERFTTMVVSENIEQVPEAQVISIGRKE